MRLERALETMGKSLLVSKAVCQPQRLLMILYIIFLMCCTQISVAVGFRVNAATTTRPPVVGTLEKAASCKMLQVWCDCRTLSDKDHILDFKVEQPDAVLALSTSPEFDFQNKGQEIPLFLEEDDKKLRNKENNAMVGLVVSLSNDDDDEDGGSGNPQEQALAALGSVEWLLVSSSTWQMIPAENLIAAAKGTGTKLVFCVYEASDVGGLARALELGVDGLCVAADAPQELWRAAWEARKERFMGAEKTAEARKASTPVIVTGQCWRRTTKTTLLADRVCVDLIQSLSSTEGCFIGSSAKTMALILSEAAASQFVPTRPFRVNAGPVHSYILMGDNVTTKYLCELQPGDEVLVYNSASGTSRGVAVGRLKQEVRPCVLVELEAPASSPDKETIGSAATPLAQVLLQQAETVRLAQEGTDFVRVTDLKASKDPTATATKGKVPVLLRLMSSGTHIGKVYDGKVVER